MGLKYSEWKFMELGVVEGTPGGDTWKVGGASTCFCPLASTVSAVYRLTNNRSKDPDDIIDEEVQELTKLRLIKVDRSGCEDGEWQGCRVWDVSGYVGEVGERCSLPAGKGTSHEGTGRCRHHGGLTSKQPQSVLTTGKHSTVVRNSLVDKVEDYEHHTADILDLSHQLAIQRVALDTMLALVDKEMEEDSDPRTLYRMLQSLVTTSDQVGRLAERVASIDQKYALTAGQVKYLQLVVIDVITKYISDPIAKEKAAKELASRMGGERILNAPITIKGDAILVRGRR